MAGPPPPTRLGRQDTRRREHPLTPPGGPHSNSSSSSAGSRTRSLDCRPLAAVGGTRFRLRLVGRHAQPPATIRCPVGPDAPAAARVRRDASPPDGAAPVVRRPTTRRMRTGLGPPPFRQRPHPVRCPAPGHGSRPSGTCRGLERPGPPMRPRTTSTARLPTPSLVGGIVQRWDAISGQYRRNFGPVLRDRLVDAPPPFRLVRTNAHGDPVVEAWGVRLAL